VLRVVDAAPHPLDLGQVGPAGQITGGLVQQGLGLPERAGTAAGLGRAEPPPAPGGRAAGERGGPLERGRGRRPAAALVGPLPGPFEFRRHGLVRSGSGHGQVPGPLLGVDGRVGGGAQGRVHPLPFGERSAVVHRRADQRVPEAHRVPDGQQVPGLGGRGRPGGEPELLSGLPQQLWVAGRIGCGRQQQHPGVGGQPAYLPQVTLLELAADRHRVRQRRVAAQLAGSELLADLDQGQRVAVRLGHDLPGHGRVQLRTGRGRQQLDRVPFIQPGHDQTGQPAEQAGCGGGLADREDHGDGVRVQPAGHECERVSRFTIQPLSVVDQAEQRLPGGLVGQQAQGGQADQEPVRSRAFPQAEGQLQRGALRRGEHAGPVQVGPQQLVQGPEAELDVGLDAVGPDNGQAGRGRLRVVEQRRLAHARLAAEHHGTAQSGPCVSQNPVQPVTLRAPPEQAFHQVNLRQPDYVMFVVPGSPGAVRMAA
jgi:hypothetical protein